MASPSHSLRQVDVAPVRASRGSVPSVTRLSRGSRCPKDADWWRATLGWIVPYTLHFLRSKVSPYGYLVPARPLQATTHSSRVQSRLPAFWQARAASG